jgi:hypothetical protein
MWQLCHRCSSYTRTDDLSSFKIGQVSHFLSLSHGLSLSTITSAPTRALQGVKKRKNTQCWQLKFFQFSQHKPILFLIFLVFPIFCQSPACSSFIVRYDTNRNSWESLKFLYFKLYILYSIFHDTRFSIKS